MHKWWAQRLGSVFRGILIGALTEPGGEVLARFYRPVRLKGIVFDPFMGSGTTIGEALKLGLRAVGRDINPVSEFIVRVALAKHDRSKVEAEFASIERDVRDAIRKRYQCLGPDGSVVDALYFFWVKVVRCPGCDRDVDLFSSYVFAKNAYAHRIPRCRVICRGCGEVGEAKYGEHNYECSSCHDEFDPIVGPVRGAKVQCGYCRQDFSIANAVRREGGPPRHRMYAKLVLHKQGRKTYLRTTAGDALAYEEAATELSRRPGLFPVVSLADGHNTKQVLNYGYRYWHEMFNERQLLCLGLLAERIRSIGDTKLRDLFITLFSGTLEFSNMFASYKGEGTGAVRHKFSHHVLKPERMPIEANVWGTSKSSGSFATLFKSRVLRALDYADRPFEIRANGGEKKIFFLSDSMGYEASRTFGEFNEGNVAVYLSCGDSADTDLPDESIDAIVTDPPFFDNVHYSELADFFYVWQQHVVHGPSGGTTTRREGEVQSTDADIFARRLMGVLRECKRVLKRNGILAFTYHHSRPDGWKAVLSAVVKSGFWITAVQPVKSEMSVATPKSRASHPIDVDVVFVCRKSGVAQFQSRPLKDVVSESQHETLKQADRFLKVGRRLGYGDLRVVFFAHMIRQLSHFGSADEADELLNQLDDRVESLVDGLWRIHSEEPVVHHGQLPLVEEAALP